MRYVIALGSLILFAVVLYSATTARPLSPSATDGLTGDAAAGEAVFWAAGCASCHAADDAEGADKLILAGGQAFPSPYGTFVAPNISPDPDHGIGGWTLAAFAGALTRGVSPDGQHYYPAFPYTAYALMELQDIADLKAYMDTLPAAGRPDITHDLAFPFNMRRTLAVWKWGYLRDDWVMAPVDGAVVERGRYLVEALSHCAECHTPRDALGGLDRARWMAGAPNPAGEGRIPDITPAGLDWSATDIAYYLESGFTPDYDVAGGHMARVVQNLARLPATDRAAIVAYLKALPPVD